MPFATTTNGSAETLADFATLAIRQQRLQKLKVQQERSDAAIALANSLAHRINNPLQGITNHLFLASQGDGLSKQDVSEKLMPEFDRLNYVIKRLLELPTKRSRTRAQRYD